MSRSPHLELHNTDSQVLGPLDSISLPSEPPDIREWFPSYIYQSPELNTLDGFQDFDGSGETCLQKEKKGKYGENQPVGKFDDDLLSAAKKSSDGIIKCNESDESEYSKSAALVTGLSESLSFSSEPPDIKNWFSSYFYESAPLDTTHDLAISDYKEREDGKLCNAQKSCRQDNKNVMDFIDVEESIELPSQSRISDVVVKWTNLVKDTKLDYQPVCKDVQNVTLMPMPSILSQLTSGKVSEQMLPGQRTGSNNHGSVEKFGNTNTYGIDYDAKLDCSLSDRTSPKLLYMENNIGSRNGKSLHKSIGMKDCIQDSLEKEDLHEIVSPGTLDLTVTKGVSCRRLTDRRSIGKENEETELLGNGFISVRKSSQAYAGNVTRHVRVQFESLRNGVKPALNRERNANISRKVLSETSNFQSPSILESTGKWSCPQKNKPNLGPPLKQLRLEQWVRRL
ncbi:hypothetical protein Pfo_025676 [Paulownia fortunei]|nr:hypothetical protein Pfo_025676 [Paulownia fortunei]